MININKILKNSLLKTGLYSCCLSTMLLQMGFSGESHDDLFSIPSSQNNHNAKKHLDIEIFGKKSNAKQRVQDIPAYAKRDKKSDSVSHAYPSLRLSGIQGLSLHPSIQFVKEKDNKYGLNFNFDFSQTSENYKGSDSRVFLENRGKLYGVDFKISKTYKKNIKFNCKVKTGAHDSSIGLSRVNGSLAQSFYDSKKTSYALSDIELGASYQVDYLGFEILPFTIVKIATGSKKDVLSTGSEDYSAGLSIRYIFENNLSMVAQASYNMIGKMEFQKSGINSLNLKDGFTASLGINSPINKENKHGSLAAAIYYSENPFRVSSNIRQMKDDFFTIGFLYDSDKKASLNYTLGINFGLSDSAPNSSIGLSFLY